MVTSQIVQRNMDHAQVFCKALNESILIIYKDDLILNYLVEEFKPADKINPSHEVYGKEISHLMEHFLTFVPSTRSIDVVQLNTKIETFPFIRLGFSSDYLFLWVRPQ